MALSSELYSSKEMPRSKECTELVLVLVLILIVVPLEASLPRDMLSSSVEESSPFFSHDNVDEKGSKLDSETNFSHSYQTDTPKAANG
jgi:hypothetical protein